jgi:hypothetical protein
MFRTLASVALVAGTALISTAGVASAAGHGAGHTRAHPRAHAVRAALQRRPGVLLKVTSVSGDTIYGVNHAAVPVTVTVTTSTTIAEAGAPATMSAIAPASFIRVRGTRTAPHALTARAIAIVVPHRIGKITGISGTTLTLTAAFGRTYTVQTGPSTTYVYRQHPKKAASFAALTLGTRVAVAGTLSADKTTITALRIVILPAHPARALPAGRL